MDKTETQRDKIQKLTENVTELLVCMLKKE